MIQWQSAVWKMKVSSVVVHTQWKQISLGSGCRELSTFESSSGCRQHSAKTSQNKSFEMDKNCSHLAIIVSPAQAAVAFGFISKYYDCIQEFLLLYTYTDFFSPPKAVSEQLLLVVNNKHSKVFEMHHRGSFFGSYAEIPWFLPARTMSVAVNHLLYMNYIWSGDLRDAWTSESCWTHEWFNQEPWWTEEVGPLCDSLIKHFKLRRDSFAILI